LYPFNNVSICPYFSLLLFLLVLSPGPYLIFLIAQPSRIAHKDLRLRPRHLAHIALVVDQVRLPLMSTPLGVSLARVATMVKVSFCGIAFLLRASPMFAQVTVSAARSMAAVTAELPAGLLCWALVTSRNGDRSMRRSRERCSAGEGCTFRGTSIKV